MTNSKSKTIDKLELAVEELAFQVADEAVEWTKLMHAARESDSVRNVPTILVREASLMSLALSYESHRDVYYGLVEGTNGNDSRP